MQLIRRLLTFSRRQSLAPTAVEVGVLVHNMTHLLARTLGETIRIHLRLPETPVQVQANAAMLSLALANLIDNAIKYTPRGGSVTARTRYAGSPVDGFPIDATVD